jgi:hypothetical protein
LTAGDEATIIEALLKMRDGITKVMIDDANAGGDDDR